MKQVISDVEKGVDTIDFLSNTEPTFSGNQEIMAVDPHSQEALESQRRRIQASCKAAERASTETLRRPDSYLIG